MTAILSVSQLRVSYGQIEALHGIDLEVNEGEIVTLIGANGAGKTTTLRTISGLLKPRSGEVTYDGRTITGQSTAHAREQYPRCQCKQSPKWSVHSSPSSVDRWIPSASPLIGISDKS